MWLRKILHDEFVRRQNGEAMTKKVPLLEWSDMTTSRWQSAVHNLMGESLQLHRDHLMEDVQQKRPVFVGYRSFINYVVEAVLVVASWFIFDMTMHMGFGFGLNEVYIMTAHWAFIFPIGAAYLLRRSPSGALRLLVAALTVWLWAWNGTIIVGYLV